MQKSHVTGPNENVVIGKPRTRMSRVRKAVVTLFLDFQTKNCKKIHFCCIIHLICLFSFDSPQQTDTITLHCKKYSKWIVSNMFILSWPSRITFMTNIQGWYEQPTNRTQIIYLNLHTQNFMHHKIFKLHKHSSRIIIKNVFSLIFSVFLFVLYVYVSSTELRLMKKLTFVQILFM